MGAGKTSVAGRLAAALDRPLRDSDAEMERRYGRTAAQHSEWYGDASLHEWEAQELRQAVAQRPPPVVAAAASVVEDPACRAALADAYVVWLDAPVEVLAARVTAGEHRPHHDTDPVALLAAQHARRSGWFAEVADVTVDAGRSSPQEATAAALAALNPQ